MDDSIYDLLSRGRAAARAGDTDEARFFLNWVLDRCPAQSTERLESLYWLSRISRDNPERRRLLEEILATEPFNPRARQDLAVLDGSLDPANVINPDQLPAPSPDMVRSVGEQAQRFTCPKCGGRLSYTPDGQNLICESCDTRQHLLHGNWRPGLPAKEDFLLSMVTIRGHSHTVQIQCITCNGCGAEFLLPPVALTGNCPYCGSSYAVGQNMNRDVIPPAGIIPMSISSQEVASILHEIFEKRDSNLSAYNLDLQGFYLPAWNYTLGGILEWRGFKERKGKKIQVSGSVPVSAGNVVVPGSPHFQDQFLPLLKTYTLQKSLSFDFHYLVDWPAETYSISVGDASLRARKIVLDQMQSEMREIQCRGVEGLQISSAGMVVESFQLLLLPVWRVSMIGDGQTQDVLVNGQNGSIDGEACGDSLLEKLRDLFRLSND